jgi:hypothetical protein
MKEKGIDVYLVQETWLSDEFENSSNINGVYLFHHEIEHEASDSNEGKEEKTPHLQTRKGHARGCVAIFLSLRAKEAWKRAGQRKPITSRNILGCARFIAL